MEYIMYLKGERYIVTSKPEKITAFNDDDVLKRREKPIEKFKMKCTHCGEEVEREVGTWKVVSCFDCKKKRIKEVAKKQNRS